LEKTCEEMNGFPVLVNEPKTTRLNGETVGNIKITPYGNPGTIFFVLLNFELAREKPKHFSPLGDEFWKCPNLHVVSAVQWKVRPIHKNGLAPGVSMHIQIRHDLVLVCFLDLLHQMAQVKGLWHKFLVGVAEETIDVPTNEGAARVSDGHPIGVDHRNYLENALLPQCVGHLVLTQQKLYDSVNHPRGIGLARMYSASDDDHLLTHLLVSGVAEVRDRQHGHVYATQARCDIGGLYQLKGVFIDCWIMKLILHLFLFKVLYYLLLFLGYLINHVRHHAEGVRERIREKYFVMIVLKSVIPP
jgi:hypothetical protein